MVSYAGGSVCKDGKCTRYIKLVLTVRHLIIAGYPVILFSLVNSRKPGGHSRVSKSNSTGNFLFFRFYERYTFATIITEYAYARIQNRDLAIAVPIPDIPELQPQEDFHVLFCQVKFKADTPTNENSDRH